MRDYTYHVGIAEAGYGNPRNQSVSFEIPLVMRAIWKGSISFGLVNIPIALYPATRKEDLKRGGIGRYGPFEADVTAGQMTKVEWRCDTGMR